MSEMGDEEIRRRAYERYLARGSEPGDEVEDWLAAEREMRRPDTADSTDTMGATPERTDRPRMDARSDEPAGRRADGPATGFGDRLTESARRGMPGEEGGDAGATARSRGPRRRSGGGDATD
jgi:hypothetical protein